jgi:hypothetical protein
MDKIETDAVEHESYTSCWGFAKRGQLGAFKHANSSINPVMIEIGNSVISDCAAGENHCIFTESISANLKGSKNDRSGKLEHMLESSQADNGKNVYA